MLHTVFIELEAVVNLRRKTTKMISDTQSLLPLSPTNIITMKSKVIKLPPRTFSAADSLDCKMVVCKLFKNGKLDVLLYRGSVEN